MRAMVSFALFGSSLILLYGISTLYHSAQNPQLRSRLRIADHACIYVLIAGTYTPFTLVVLQGSIGWGIFTATWIMAMSGIVLKLFYTGRASYTLGAILYSIKRLPLNHAIFHLLVLIGSSCHFVAVYFFIA